MLQVPPNVTLHYSLCRWFQFFAVQSDDQKRTERDIIEKYSISSEDKSYLLNKILYDAVSEVYRDVAQ